MTRSASEAVEALRRSARERREAAAGERRRVVVQLGHCSQSVGAAEVARALTAALADDAYVVIAGCDGACFQAPKVVVTGRGGSRQFALVGLDDVDRILAAIAGPLDDEEDAGLFFAGQRRIAMEECGVLDSLDIDEYLIDGGYDGLANALDSKPEAVIEEVEASGLRGRGGAYFPPALKWRGVRSQEAAPAYLVVNSEEGEPGVFKDRHLMEGVPHRIVEGAAIAAYASGAGQAYIYINAEADLSAERMAAAVAQACDRGLLGKDILGSGFSLDVEILRGAGGYVCGEETTLLDTMEGYRREPRLRPPYPTEAGLFGKPTVINNPETLASVPYILTNGAGLLRGDRARGRQRHQDRQPQRFGQQVRSGGGPDGHHAEAHSRRHRRGRAGRPDRHGGGGRWAVQWGVPDLDAGHADQAGHAPRVRGDTWGGRGHRA